MTFLSSLGKYVSSSALSSSSLLMSESLGMSSRAWAIAFAFGRTAFKDL
jgi:hypothetical protein